MRFQIWFQMWCQSDFKMISQWFNLRFQKWFKMRVQIWFQIRFQNDFIMIWNCFGIRFKIWFQNDFNLISCVFSNMIHPCTGCGTSQADAEERNPLRVVANAHPKGAPSIRICSPRLPRVRPWHTPDDTSLNHLGAVFPFGPTRSGFPGPLQNECWWAASRSLPCLPNWCASHSVWSPGSVASSARGCCERLALGTSASWFQWTDCGTRPASPHPMASPCLHGATLPTSSCRSAPAHRKKASAKDPFHFPCHPDGKGFDTYSASDHGGFGCGHGGASIHRMPSSPCNALSACLRDV